MKRILIITAILFAGISGYSQTYKPEDASKHIGDSITICGKAFGGKFLENAKNQPTFINMGAAFPNHQLTIVIWADVRKKLSYIPEEKLKDKDICITGKIEEYKGKPQIVLQDPGQIKFE